ncbi:DUF4097 family beta strand repeat-containing protein [Catenovulum sediminis]|uniref:DUF4097 family beta strand repeat-containing protein n=1 Tax=Catenovulum sediminis TaxID=1740262 RepID=A0ABV1RGT7_9ALTE
MKKLIPSILTAACLAVTTLSVYSQDTVDVESFDLTDIQHLELDFNHAQIEITNSTDNQLHIELNQTLKRGQAEKCLHKIKVSKSSDRLKLSTDTQSFSWFNNCSVEKTIKVKIGKSDLLSLNLSNHHAVVKVDSLQAKALEVNFHHSQVDLNMLLAESLDFDFHHGKGTINAVNANQVEIEGGHSQLEIGVIRGQSIESEWNHGTLVFNRSQFEKTNIDSAHAKIEFKQHTGHKLNIDGRHSHLATHVEQMQKVKLQNKHGHIEFIGSAENIYSSNAHGATYLKQTSNQNFAIQSKASHGNVVVEIPEGTQYNQAESGLSKNSISFDISHGVSKVTTF